MKCNQATCNEPAEVEYVWPTDGTSKFSCMACFRKAEGIMGTMGFRLSILGPARDAEGTEEGGK